MIDSTHVKAHRWAAVEKGGAEAGCWPLARSAQHEDSRTRRYSGSCRAARPHSSQPTGESSPCIERTSHESHTRARRLFRSAWKAVAAAAARAARTKLNRHRCADEHAPPMRNITLFGQGAMFR